MGAPVETTLNHVQGLNSSFCLRKIATELTSVPIFLHFVYEMLLQYGVVSGV